jgi:putative transcriptional regulator
MGIFKQTKTVTVFNTVVNWRKTAGITQAELANAVGVSRQTIISIEKGNYVPSVLLAMKIANFFETNVEDIFSYE